MGMMLMKIAEDEKKGIVQRGKEFAGRHKKKLIGAGVLAATLAAAPGAHGIHDIVRSDEFGGYRNTMKNAYGSITEVPGVKRKVGRAIQLAGLLGHGASSGYLELGKKISGE
jgi:hypothetical protein